MVHFLFDLDFFLSCYCHFCQQYRLLDLFVLQQWQIPDSLFLPISLVLYSFPFPLDFPDFTTVLPVQQARLRLTWQCGGTPGSTRFSRATSAGLSTMEKVPQGPGASQPLGKLPGGSPGSPRCEDCSGLIWRRPVEYGMLKGVCIVALEQKPQLYQLEICIRVCVVPL